MDKKKQITLLVFLILLLFIIDYPFIDRAIKKSLLEHEFGIVERVIDGDTIVINKTSVRLLGINSPERGELYYSEAGDFLEELVLNKTVKLRFSKDKYDKYDRILAYIFIDKENVNQKVIEKGFANIYFPSGKDIYYKNFKRTWEGCIKENINLCESSKNECADCIELKEFNYEKQEVIFYNKCEFDCDLGDWETKDEGRKTFVFPEFILEKNHEIKIKVGEGINNKTILFWEDEEYVWTESGDSLFLRDGEGKLVLWESY